MMNRRNMKIRIGTRESLLAVTQTKIVENAIKRIDANIETEIVPMKTTGDIILDRTLDKVGGKGLFVKELEAALYRCDIDIAVHSLKDVTIEDNEELPLVAFSKREEPFDALVLPEGTDKLDLSKPIGCSSARRITQLKKIYKDASFEMIRGNIHTRLKKLDSGRYSATILACAGLNRMGLSHRISRAFSEKEILPAAGQGVLAIQSNLNALKNERFVQILKDINDEDSKMCSIAERSFVRTLNGGCSSPIAAYAKIIGEKMSLSGFFVDDKGNTFNHTIYGYPTEGEKMGIELAKIVSSDS